MHVICCVDDRFGLAFNHRRVSSDCVVTEDILNRVDHSTLWTDEYSAKLFTGNSPANFVVDLDALEKAGPNEFVFTERKDPLQYKNRIEKITVYFWNRNYPSDVKLSYNESDWERKVIAEFPGHSHEKVTVEEWTPRI